MISKKKDLFTSQFGFFISILATAIGAGNIWRFSRIVAQNGGGSFIIAWAVFLFTWSIPLIISEIALGKWTQKAPIGALAICGGRKMGWMGAFVALVTTVILFYYSVVVGWGISYFFYAIFGQLERDPAAVWNTYSQSPLPLLTHFFAVGIGIYIVYKGISKGIEKYNKIFIPVLFACILIIAVRALTLPDAFGGLKALFHPNLSDLKNYKVWLEALTQNAWDTGAGWGLILVLSNFAHKNTSINKNGFLTGIGNNVISLLMGMIIFSFAFSVDQSRGIQSLVEGTGSTNTGLTFIYLPKLFLHFPGPPWMHQALASLFFLSFTFAALSSMLPMIEVAVKSLIELGIAKKKAIYTIGLMTFLGGVPSALNQVFFDNQDSVWSLGLIVNGLFIAIAILKYGPKKFRKNHINNVPGDIKIGRWYDWVITYLIPIQGIALLGWFILQSVQRKNYLNPFASFSLGSLLLQWLIPLTVFFLLNKKIVKKTLGS